MKTNSNRFAVLVFLSMVLFVSNVVRADTQQVSTKKPKTKYVCFPSWGGGLAIGRPVAAVSGELFIPARIGKNNVDAIGCYAFAGSTNLTAVHIPEGIKIIGEGAFFGCSNLEEIFIPASVSKIEQNAFHGCDRSRVIYSNKRNKSDERSISGALRPKKEKEELDATTAAMMMVFALQKFGEAANAVQPYAQQRQREVMEYERMEQLHLRERQAFDQHLQLEAQKMSSFRQQEQSARQVQLMEQMNQKLDAGGRSQQMFGGGSPSVPKGFSTYHSCPTCGGTGRYGGVDMQTASPCPYCEGTGWVK